MDQFQTQRPLPNATAVLILGILSIVTCFCYGFVGLILGIIALVLATKDKRLYSTSPEMFTQTSYKNMNAGRICAIIGLILSAIYVLCIVIIIIMIGIDAVGNPDEMMRRMQELQN